jgi:hypothetical protein
MGSTERAAASVLLACAIMLVLLVGGTNPALRFPVAGTLAGIAGLATLLYAAGGWFGVTPLALSPAGAQLILVFDRSLKVVAGGSATGASVLAQFPPPVRPELEVRCRAALRGEHVHLSCDHGGARYEFDIAPVQTVNDVVLYGVLITGPGLRVPATTPAPFATVA